MYQVISTETKPIKLWVQDIEPGALEQAKNLANFPFAFRHIAIMPDVHLGYGMPIGGVLATEKVIIPNAVGVDIGCGMCALKTSLTEITQEELKHIMGGKNGKAGIRGRIPVGFTHHDTAQDESLMPKVKGKLPVISREYASALKQIGTLGGGNHFIEIQKGSDGFVWLMIHSGSRNIGYKVARHYNKVAMELNLKRHSTVPKKWELAYLSIESFQGDSYKREMEYCVDFALANRFLMMERVKEAVSDFAADTRFDPMINIAHNYAAEELHFGKKVIVHRKGATKATKGLDGIIPGSQGTSSFIVEGKGNAESFMSCSHGAGRKMGRKQAQRTLNLEAEKQRLDDRGILHGIRGKRDLDEAAGAYKDISEVMRNQEDLVAVKVTLHPLAVIKG